MTFAQLRVLQAVALPSDTAGVCAVPLDPTARRAILLAVPSDAAPLPTARAFIEHAVHEVARGGVVQIAGRAATS